MNNSSNTRVILFTISLAIALIAFATYPGRTAAADRNVILEFSHRLIIALPAIIAGSLIGSAIRRLIILFANDHRFRPRYQPTESGSVVTDPQDNDLGGPAYL
jgi:hypothetical protein